MSRAGGVRTGAHLGRLALLGLVACGVEGSQTSASEGGAETAGSGEAEAASETESGDSGETGIPVERCEEQMDEQSCAALSEHFEEPGDDDFELYGWNAVRCAWVEVLSGDAACEAAGAPVPRCIPLALQGGGCGSDDVCGVSQGDVDLPLHAYAVLGEEDDWEVFSLETCEFQPIRAGEDGYDWVNQCNWPEADSEEDVFPHPACECLCEEGG